MDIMVFDKSCALRQAMSSGSDQLGDSASTPFSGKRTGGRVEGVTGHLHSIQTTMGIALRVQFSK